MIPPTPTLMPAGTPIPIDFGNVGLWQMAPQAVGLWGTFDEYTTVLLWVIVAILIVVLLWFVISQLRRASEQEQ